MDFDADGKLDFVSGSYDDGEVSLFRGLGKSRFAAGVFLVDEQNTPLVHHPAEWRDYDRLRRGADAGDAAVVAAKTASYGSFPMPVDFDDDGDLDMLIGSLGGAVFLRPAVPVDKKVKKGPRTTFAATSVPILADGAPLVVHSHADPFAADWDGDGLWDLVVGAGDGSVGWYRNEGTAKAPRFAARAELVPPRSKDTSIERQVGADGQPLPGTRAQICVADCDGDGRNDLLVGDFARAGAGHTGRTSFLWLYRRSGPITPR